MGSPRLTKLKILVKHLLGRAVYIYVYVKKRLTEKYFSLTSSQKKKQPKNIAGFISAFAQRWKLISAVLICLLAAYYGVGAAVSSKINNSLEHKLTVTKDSPRHTTAALIYVLKSQVDDSAWTPALPAIFPAAVLDNLPEFQLGAKDSVRYFIGRLSRFYKDENLKEAGELLDYPADIWLFSQNKKGVLSPGSARQYRKALTRLTDFAFSDKNRPVSSADEFLYILTGIETLLNRQISVLHRHVLEHNSEWLDFKADNIFYRAEGNAYTVYYLLQALSKDFQSLITEETDQYENITAALSFLNEALSLNPVIIKNAAPEDAFAANHLLYLGYYLSRALATIRTVRYNIELKRK